jgi:flagellar hook-associated protein 1 FlgK
MSLSLSLAIASSEIGNINSQFSLIGNNIANASTPDYATEEISQSSVEAGGVGVGAVNNAVQRDIDTQVQDSLFAQNGTVAALQTQQTALQQIDAVQGVPGSGADLSSQVTALGNAFSTLLNDPSNSTQQSAVVSAAQQLAGQINTVSQAIGTARQNAQNSIVSDVQTINTTLSTIGTLSNSIVNAQAAGQSTANLQQQRDAAEATLSGLVGVNYLNQANGDVLVVAGSGLVLPTHGGTPALTTSNATVSASTYAGGGGVPAITLDGTDVTSQLTGGSLGGEITLRDQTLPTQQAGLDEFAETLSTGFEGQGLTLFTDANGNVPTGGGTPTQSTYLGYASSITVNPAVVADPSQVRDGNTTTATFTPNPSGGPAGFTTLITNILNNTFGSATTPNSSGLGASGTLSLGFNASPVLGDFASALVAQSAEASSSITSQLTTEQGVQTGLQTTMSARSSVSVDTEMSNMIQLQNAYGANARVMTTVQSLFATLMQSVQT